MDAFSIPDITNNIIHLINNPQLCTVLNVLATNPNLLNDVSKLIETQDTFIA